jgi:hypothetical protein
LCFEEGGAHWLILAIHLEGAMRASQTVLPFTLTASDESLTAHAGLVLFDEYLGAMDIAGLINHELSGAATRVRRAAGVPRR